MTYDWPYTLADRTNATMRDEAKQNLSCRHTTGQTAVIVKEDGQGEIRTAICWKCSMVVMYQPPEGALWMTED